MTDNLAPCPFCGGEPKLRTHRSGEDSMECYVECPSCEVRTTYYEDAYAPVLDATGAWNRRTPPPSTHVELDYPAEISALQKRVWELRGAINNAIYTCRLWAKESRTGGWSTHQVDANNKLADGLEQTVGSVKEQHPDDKAAASFLWAMIEKLAKKRREGVTGWWDKNELSNEHLTKLLREHVDKGDPIDVANLAMMIHQRGETITPAPVTNVVPDEDAVETVARRIYEDAHKGMSNIWSWNDRGLDDEHPGTRERYLGYARSAIAATPPPVQNLMASSGDDNVPQSASEEAWQSDQPINGSNSNRSTSPPISSRVCGPSLKSGTDVQTEASTSTASTTSFQSPTSRPLAPSLSRPTATENGPAPQPNVDVEDVARRIYEDAHRGMSNIWAWDDRGLDDEHPGTRERYLRYAQSAIDALAPPPQTREVGTEDLRKRVMRAIFDPGETVGAKGDRDLTTRQTDAVMNVLSKTEQAP